MASTDRFIWAGWATYATYYVARVALAAAKPSLANLGYSYVTLSWFDFGFLCAYAVGQLISGQMADRLSCGRMLIAGLVSSSILCAAVGAVGINRVGLGIWIMHGLAQSLGWTPLLRGTRLRVAPKNVALAMCFIATAYQCGSALGHALGGVTVQYLSWRGPFVLPLLLCPTVAWASYKHLRTESLQLPLAGDRPVTRQATRAFWVLAVSLVLINILRYGQLLWLPTMLVELARLSIQSSSAWSAIIVAAGIAGTLLVGLLTRGCRLTSVITLSAVLLLVIASLCVNIALGDQTRIHIIVSLLAIAPCLNASHAIAVAVVPALAAAESRVGAAAGMLDSVGYLGTGVASVLVGYFANAGAWSKLTLQWAAIALVSATVTAVASYLLRNDVLLPNADDFGVSPSLFERYRGIAIGPQVYKGETGHLPEK